MKGLLFKIKMLLSLMIALVFSSTIYSQQLIGIDTIIVDRNNNTYTSIPAGFQIVDTLTVKDDSTVHYFNHTSSGNQTLNINLGRNYARYFTTFQAWVGPSPNTHGNITIDTNTVNYLSLNISNGGSTAGLFLDDTLILDSASNIYIANFNDKNSMTHLTIEAYHTTTKFIIDNITGIKSVDADDHLIRIYPNPANEVVKLVCKDDILGQSYFIFSAVGKTVLEGKIDGNPLDVFTLESGLYFLSIPQEGYTGRIIKQ